MLLNKKTAGCDDFRELMLDYIDGALSDADAVALEAHITKCASCRGELAELREMLALVKSSSEPVPSELYGCVMAEVDKTPQDKKILTPRLRVKPWMSSLAAVAAAVMILVVGRGFIDGGASAEMLDVKPRGLFDAADTPADADDVIVAEGEAAHDKANYSVQGDAAESDRVVETTASVVAYSPSPLDTAAGVSEAARGDGLTYADEADLASTLDEVLLAYTSDESALIVCEKSVLDGIIGVDSYRETLINGTVCKHYLIETDVAVKLVGYIEVLENSGAEYRAYVLDDSEPQVLEVILTENEE